MKGRYCSGAWWGILRVLKKLGLLHRLNFEVPASIAGKRLRVPLIHGVGLNLLVADEPRIEPLLASLLEHFPGAVIDVGVNVGQTLCKVKGLEPAREYIGFEADPGSAHYSQELALRLQYSHARIIPAGLSDRDGILTLEYHTISEADTAATLVAGFRPGFPVLRRKSVSVLRFDSCKRDISINHVGLVKIDVEGGELEVLRGMEQSLMRFRPAIIIEILPPGLHHARLQRQEEVEALFSRTGHSLFRIISLAEGLRLERQHGPIGRHDDDSLANYLALPMERCEAILNSLQEAAQQ